MNIYYIYIHVHIYMYANSRQRLVVAKRGREIEAPLRTLSLLLSGVAILVDAFVAAVTLEQELLLG